MTRKKPPPQRPDKPDQPFVSPEPPLMEPSTEFIRDLVRRTLPELGLADAETIGESLLTLAGYYVGREFKFAGVRAVWMASQGQVKFYGDDGRVLRVVEVGEPEQTKAG